MQNSSQFTAPSPSGAGASIPMARQIKIRQLPDVLADVRNKKSEFNFAGITSNGIDCVYFMPNDDDRWDVDFEAMAANQVPFLEKLRQFAERRGYKTNYTTYGNMPNFKSDRPATVLHIGCNLDLTKVASFGESIETEVFENNTGTTYDVVP